MNLFFGSILFLYFGIFNNIAAPQEPNSDQAASSTAQDPGISTPQNITNTTENPINDTSIQITAIRRSGNEENCFTRVYAVVTQPIFKFISQPKVRYVLKNIGTCVVNGAMEIISYYLPAPFIPLIATAAGMVIPFEPVVTLREKMPVASYRRAFQKAVNGFLGTFDKYKVDDVDDDPYMTQRFNRRVMNLPNEKDRKSKEIEERTKNKSD